jgi:AraC family transcriptional regulator of adaptative response/methylated-DNA-[protein]-cysteine methyltransferase
MNNTENFYRIKKAIEFIAANYKRQPSLDELAETVNLSPSHFQRIFTEWAGVSPKKFIQFLSVEYAKSLLKGNKQPTLFDTALNTGLSDSGRLHDLFIQIEGMTPGEYKNGGENLIIHYSFSPSPFGKIIIASTAKGICHLEFNEDEEAAFNILRKTFPKAQYALQTDDLQINALSFFNKDWTNQNQIKLHLKGTDFQLKVWKALLSIPSGDLISYGNLAKKLDNPNASRAVGSAVGDNPIAFLIPCHRVIQTSGEIGQYHWESARKAAIIGWEAALLQPDKDINS